MKISEMLRTASPAPRMRRAYGEPKEKIGKIRIKWWGHPKHMLIIQEMPSKPVKKRLHEFVLHTDYEVNVLNKNSFMMENILEHGHGVKINENMSYEQATGAIKDYIKKLTEEEGLKHPPRANETEVFYLEVEPADHKPMQVKGKDFTVDTSWKEFKAYDPASDFQQADPHYTLYVSKSAQSARTFYKMLKANPDALKQVAWGAFSSWLTQNKIAFDIRHSVWH